jgi:hypothetical protein
MLHFCCSKEKRKNMFDKNEVELQVLLCELSNAVEKDRE